MGIPCEDCHSPFLIAFKGFAFLSTSRFQPSQHIVVCERVDFHARAEFRYLRLNTLYFRRDWTISSRKGPSFPTPLWALVYAKGYFLSSRNQLENVSQRKRREIEIDI